MSKWDVLLVILNFRELSSLANNAKIRSSLKFLLVSISKKIEPNKFPYFHNKPILFLNFSTHLNFYL